MHSAILLVFGAVLAASVNALPYLYSTPSATTAPHFPAYRDYDAYAKRSPQAAPTQQTELESLLEDTWR